MFARLLAPAAALCLLALSGCGGGGGSASVAPSPAPPGGTGSQLFALPAAADGEVAAAAGNRPRAGSVTQSSNGVDGVTTDRVQVSMTFDGGESPTISVSNTPDGATTATWTMSTAAATEDNIESPEDGVVAFVIPETGGARWVSLRTDRDGETDTDYLVYGVWAWVPRDEARAEDFEIGVFADGGEPFTGANVLALTGTATYRREGGANGIYSYPDDEAEGGIENDLFAADVELTANFGAADAAGTISGAITNPTSDDGSPVAEPGEQPIVLTLGAAPIGTGDGGFFSGQASMSLNDISHTGQWGGEFFGNGAAGAAPGSVAGTFGVTGMSPTLGRATLVGAFGATR